MIRTALVLPLFLTVGCVMHDGPEAPRPPQPAEEPAPAPTVYNAAPFVAWADGGCYWDGYYHDDIWYFQADVDDPDSPFDVVAVYADVYDGYTGYWQDSFALYPTEDPYIWFSDWLGSSTYLDCNYGGYEVDIVAYDSFEEFDVMTIRPDTYNYY